MISAAVFDMDGLLFDSEPLWQEAEYQIFSQLGVAVTPELSAITATMTTQEVTAFWYQQAPWQSESLADVEQAVIDQVETLIKQKGKAKAGVKAVLELCREQGFHIALATNSPYQLIPVILDALGVRHYFDEVVSSEQVDKGKPAPDVYLKAAQKLGVKPEQCVVFEDSLTGMQAAIAAKMKVIVVPQVEHCDNAKFALSQLKLTSLLEVTKHHLGTLTPD